MSGRGLIRTFVVNLIFFNICNTVYSWYNSLKTRNEKKTGIEPLISGLENNRHYDGIEPSCPLSNDKCRLDT